jgi:hypothetical protein
VGWPQRADERGSGCPDRAGARPSIARYSGLGVLVATAGIAGALLGLYVLAPSRV